MNKKIMLVLASNEDGGLEKHVIDVANQLSMRHIDVILLADQRFSSQINASVNFIAFDFSRSRYNLIALYQFYQLIQQHNPNIIHAHGAKAVNIVGYFIHLTVFKHIQFIASLHSVKKNTKTFDKYHKIICSSHAIVSCLSNLAQNKTTVVLNGIQLPGIKHQKAITSPPILLAIGQLRKVKGFDILIQAVKNLPVQLWIAGDGEEKENLQRLIEQTQQTEKIKLLGYRDDIQQLLAQVDIHVISSLHEGGPYTFAESLLIETPVISTKVGVPQAILPEQFLAETNNINALQQLIQYSLAQPDLSQTFQPIFVWAKENLTHEAMINQLIQVYEHGKA